ncbi:methylated-DNA--[protein]-cysteine S-methyltransferase [Amnibacterium flavum]|uniref:Methylated-DNA--protein-cysteine methyltransferase n=1 Tax=Amnibacterium flavum TaxID=2173173 RepID=A0A2V1HQZ5_9MICO|nr:methylated-DNA--[protein]-cysteine S-methyltransferase [Amnibacterium flavum]PVZ95023.1 methylated-DNA--protein-cysteine methyltransferase [Amnibacterium flavum]
MTAILDTVDTPDGPFTLLAEDDRVVASGWTADPAEVLARIPIAVRPSGFDRGSLLASDAVRAYYDGEITAIDDVAVHHVGGPFRTVAWAALRTIPAGSPLTYSQFAALVGSPTAIRAAASACATNAPALFVPCHRVLRTDGSLGGFAWGLDVKRSLLGRESSTAAAG